MTFPAGENLPDQLWGWGKKFFERFSARTTGDRLLVGGLWFKTPLRYPGDPEKELRRLQSLLGTNLKNWGLKQRDSRYNRGWLRFCSKDEFRKVIMVDQIRKKWREIAKKAREQKRKARAQKWRQKHDVLKRVLKQSTKRKVKDAFSLLVEAAGIHKKRVVREAKRVLLNVERYGCAKVRASYSDDELDFCQNWKEVALHRGPPRSALQMAEWARTDAICKEQAQSARCQKPVGF